MAKAALKSAKKTNSKAKESTAFMQQQAEDNEIAVKMLTRARELNLEKNRLAKMEAEVAKDLERHMRETGIKHIEATIETQKGLKTYEANIATVESDYVDPTKLFALLGPQCLEAATFAQTRVKEHFGQVTVNKTLTTEVTEDKFVISEIK